MQHSDQLKRGPGSKAISKIAFSVPEKYELNSGIDLYSIRTPGIGALKFEIVFEAGRLYESKNLVAQCCAGLLSEGCKGWNSSELSEAFDFEGAYLSTYGNSDFITVRLTCATKSFSKLLKILGQIIAHPAFSEEELEIFASRKKQKMAVNLTKNDVISYRAITEGIYGPKSPYGYNSLPEMLDSIKSEDIHDHYKKSCISQSAHFFLSGDFNEGHLKEIDNLSNIVLKKEIAKIEYSKTQTTKKEVILKGRENQSSLRLGIPLFSRQNKDYPKIYLLNTILGGYFGSRLMKNIREEKGYTYNIYSMLDTHKYDGAWIISCELDEKYVSSTIKEIENEFERLKQEKLDEGELEMVKNYLMGNFMNTINGPLKSINPYKTEIIMGLENSFYNSLSEQILSFSAEDIRVYAQEYLNIDNFWRVIVGKA